MNLELSMRSDAMRTEVSIMAFSGILQSIPEIEQKGSMSVAVVKMFKNSMFSKVLEVVRSDIYE